MGCVMLNSLRINKKIKKKINLANLWDAYRHIIPERGAQLRTALLRKHEQGLFPAPGTAEPGQAGWRLHQASLPVPTRWFRMDIHLGVGQEGISL